MAAINFVSSLIFSHIQIFSPEVDGSSNRERVSLFLSLTHVFPFFSPFCFLCTPGQTGTETVSAEKPGREERKACVRERKRDTFSRPEFSPTPVSHHYQCWKWYLHENCETHLIELVRTIAWLLNRFHSPVPLFQPRCCLRDRHRANSVP